MPLTLYNDLKKEKYTDNFFLHFANVTYPLVLFMNKEFDFDVNLFMAGMYSKLYDKNKRIQKQVKDTINHGWHKAAYDWGSGHYWLPLPYKFFLVCIEHYADKYNPPKFPAINANYINHKVLHRWIIFLGALNKIESQFVINKYLDVFTIKKSEIKFTDVFAQDQYTQNLLYPDVSHNWHVSDYKKFLEDPLATNPTIIEMLQHYYLKYCAGKRKGFFGIA